MPWSRCRIPRAGWLSCLTLPVISNAVLAHPGHGSTPPESAAHYIVEPLHGWWIPVLLVLACGAYAAWRLRHRLTAAARQTARRTTTDGESRSRGEPH